MAEKNELMTIKAFSEASGRSQQAIYKQISTRLAAYLHEIDGQKFIERRALFEVFHIGEEVEQCNFNSTKPKKAASDKTLQLLEKTIQMLEDQLKAKDQEIVKLTEAIQAQAHSINGAQALHAETLGLLPETAPGTEIEVVDAPQSDETGKPLPEAPAAAEGLQEAVRGLSFREKCKLLFSKRKD